MKKLILGLIVVLILTAAAGMSEAAPKIKHHVKHHVKKTAVVVHHIIPPTLMDKWRLVNICEQGGKWNVRGAVYSGGLGIKNINWVTYGGERLFGPQWLATPEQQAYIARHIQIVHGFGDYVPDQNGCHGGW